MKLKGHLSKQSKQLFSLGFGGEGGGGGHVTNMACDWLTELLFLGDGGNSRGHVAVMSCKRHSVNYYLLGG